MNIAFVIRLTCLTFYQGLSVLNCLNCGFIINFIIPSSYIVVIEEPRVSIFEVFCQKCMQSLPKKEIKYQRKTSVPYSSKITRYSVQRAADT